MLKTIEQIRKLLHATGEELAAAAEAHSDEAYRIRDRAIDADPRFIRGAWKVAKDHVGDLAEAVAIIIPLVEPLMEDAAQSAEEFYQWRKELAGIYRLGENGHDSGD